MQAAADTVTQGASEFVSIEHAGVPLRIEFARIGAERTDRPLIVFLHEGLGSVAQWRDFPRRLCDAVQARGLVYSRPGYGRSTPRAAAEGDEREVRGDLVGVERAAPRLGLVACFKAVVLRCRGEKCL